MGFSLSDVRLLSEAEDVRTLESVLMEVYKQEQIDRLRFKLDVAEAVNVAFVGSQHGKQNQTSYSRWQRSVERAIAKLRDQRLETVWDLPRKSMRLGR